ncbi:efflux RND transporter periplasmic adaptor subunit [Novosphingobium album (ex Liu et al. 2023)]|uniref:Efflux RND transporter periplasmic adaptor subunit n=1 Tax=Novosphingobium album (ex Liu et al. 2023) TaxID=3031130 RepID=A0ABT5WTF5_9SPHN|nr:efflux RND transporter periplasmic adaptor subunit [Novosphingobium album (ex Liu et al. 2023)]MDE8653127.1 efflux RND transporter periplasmic adaptor subunit [Novosphingobium album (ex Liu et al. 2023)]
MPETLPPQDPATDDAIPAGPDGRTLRRIGIGAAAVALAVVVIGTASRINAVDEQRATAAQAAIPTVTVLTPEADAGGGTLVLPGTIQAFNSAPIYARTNGYVRRWLVDIGDHVRAGQTLAILDAPEIDQQLAQAEADFQTARANQGLAATTARRWDALLAQDAVSRQEADEKRGDLAARSALSNAALANVRRLRALQGFTRLSAPFAGVVTSRSAQIGALVVAGNAASQPLFTVSDVSRMRIFVRVPQGNSASVKPGMSATLSLPEFPGRSFTATMTRSAQAVDAQSGAVLVELQAPNPDGALKPGAYARVSFATSAGTGQAAGATLSLPGSTILYGNDGPRLAVVDGRNRVSLKPITIVRDDGAKVFVSGAISARDRVIDTPPDSIRDGDEVRVQKAPAAPEKSPAKGPASAR